MVLEAFGQSWYCLKRHLLRMRDISRICLVVYIVLRGEISKTQKLRLLLLINPLIINQYPDKLVVTALLRSSISLYSLIYINSLASILSLLCYRYLESISAFYYYIIVCLIRENPLKSFKTLFFNILEYYKVCYNVFGIVIYIAVNVIKRSPLFL